MRKRVLLAHAYMCLAAQLSAQTLSDAEVTDLIEKAQSISARQLDPLLPREPFAEWLRLQMPRDARFGWAVRTATTGNPSEVTHTTPSVKVDVSVDGHPLVTIYLICNAAPTVHSILVIKGRDVTEVSRLRDVRAALAK